MIVKMPIIVINYSSPFVGEKTRNKSEKLVLIPDVLEYWEAENEIEFVSLLIQIRQVLNITSYSLTPSYKQSVWIWFI